MSEATIFKPLTHWMLPQAMWDSKTLDRGIGLTWRNISPDMLLEFAVSYEHTNKRFSNLLWNAALLKEDAIKHGINLEDKL